MLPCLQNKKAIQSLFTINHGNGLMGMFMGKRMEEGIHVEWAEPDLKGGGGWLLKLILGNEIS